MAALAHAFVHVPVAHLGLDPVDARFLEGLAQAVIAHDGAHHGVGGQLIPFLHVRAVNVEDHVAVQLVALFVHG